jgi:hypothetical protein
MFFISVVLVIEFVISILLILSVLLVKQQQMMKEYSRIKRIRRRRRRRRRRRHDKRRQRRRRRYRVIPTTRKGDLTWVRFYYRVKKNKRRKPKHQWYLGTRILGTTTPTVSSLFFITR